MLQNLRRLDVSLQNALKKPVSVMSQSASVLIVLVSRQSSFVTLKHCLHKFGD